MIQEVCWLLIFAMCGLYIVLAIAVYAMRRKAAALKRREYQLLLDQKYVDRRAEQLDKKLFHGLS